MMTDVECEWISAGGFSILLCCSHVFRAAKGEGW